MIEYKRGDILKESAEALVNTVNCVGVMGRGIALQFKKAFPDNYQAYKRASSQDEVRPGQMFVYETGTLTNPRYIINFPTKQHWRAKSRIEDIESGLKALNNTIREHGIRSIALPSLGCGLGGLEWTDVKPRIEASLGSLSGVCVIVFEPVGAPEAKAMVHGREVPAMTPGRAALVKLMERYLEGLIDPFITLLEVHKLLYFLQEAGEGLRLNYQKGPYGPYAKNLRHVLNVLEGHYISGYADGGDAPQKHLELMRGATEAADEQLRHHPDTQKHLDKTTALVAGFESPYGLELLATIHWVITKESANSFDEVVDKVYAWNVRKRRFTERQIKMAIDTLVEHSLIPSL